MDNNVIVVTGYLGSPWQEFTELTLREHSPKAKHREDDIKARGARQ